jgi:hypothetical protein
MRAISENNDQETAKKPDEQPTCPLCESPLIGEAIEAGRCQCCGHRFDPKEVRKNQGQPRPQQKRGEERIFRL